MRYFDIYPKQADVAKFGSKLLGEEPVLHDNVRLYDCHIGAWTELGSGTFMVETTFGDYSYAAGDVDMIYTEVGKFCSIASHVRVNPGNHPIERVTQHHMTYRRRQYGFGDDDADFFAWRRAHKCTIGHDVWLGHGVLVMAGITIGTGAVVGAGAVVTKDLAPYSINVGVPAKPVRQRFSDEVIEKLLKIAWWNWDRVTLAARFNDLLDMPTFLEKYG
jgi:phosphonate metabolism protein (transferase hexapeptide repeat family)